PKVWDDEEMLSLQLPLVDSKSSPKQISADYYYRIPVRRIYKSYPVYAPASEPPGYFEWLKQQEPESAFDTAKLKTESDWIAAGEIVFDSPLYYDVLVKASDVRDPGWYERTGTRAAKNGWVPWARYVIREKGKVELGTVSCGMCHTRVTTEGTVLKGAQGNFPFEKAGEIHARETFTLERLKRMEQS